VQALSAVRELNFRLSAWASFPFCALKPDPDPEADELVAAVGVGVRDELAVDAAEDGVAWVAVGVEDVLEADAAEDGVAWVAVGVGDVLLADAAEDGVTWAAESDAEEGGFCVVPFAAPLPPGAPGELTISVSCCPAGTGPEGFAGQLPGGFRGPFWPNGIVPGAPSALPSANFLGSTPSNWHWKSPLSSAFRGFCWQYGTLRELGWQFTKRTKVG
jgi:hypothetical protein